VAEDNEAVLFYRRVRLWESPRLCGKLRAYKAAIRDSERDYFRQVFQEPRVMVCVYPSKFLDRVVALTVPPNRPRSWTPTAP
jgi:hypothetical protein